MFPKGLKLPEWSNAQDYKIGDYVLKSNTLYQASLASGPNISGVGYKDPEGSGNDSYWSSPLVKTGSVLDNSDTSASTQWVKDATEYRAIYVDGTNGDDSNDGLTSETAVKTIGRGIQRAENRARWLKYIHIAGGTYTENIDVESFCMRFFIQGNVTLNGWIRLSAKSSLTISDESTGHTFNISSGGNHCITLSNTSYFVSMVPLSLTSSGAAYALFISMGSLCTLTNTLTINASNTTTSVIAVYDRSELYATQSVTITGSSNAHGMHLQGKSVSVLNQGITIGSGVSSSSAIAVEESYLSLAGTSTIYGGTGYTLDIFSNSRLNVANYSTLSVTKTGSGGAALSVSSGSLLYIQVASGRTVSFNAGSSATDILHIDFCGSLRVVGGGTLSLNGTITGSTITCYENACVDIATGLTINGTVSKSSTSGSQAYRFTVDLGGQIQTHGGGANRLPGVTTGKEVTANFGKYS